MRTFNNVSIDQHRKAPGGVAFDFGCNQGGYLPQLSLMVEGGVVYGFEPVPHMFHKILDRIGAGGDLCDQVKHACIQVYQMGVSDRSTYVDNLNVYNAWTLLDANCGRNDLAAGSESKPFGVAFITLDDFVYQEEIKRIDVMKVDVDGYEVKFLRGARKTIQRFKPFMYFEFSYLVTMCGDTIEDLVNEVFNLGYWVFPMVGEHDSYGQHIPDLTRAILKQPSELMQHFPMHTSWDAFLVHQDDTELLGKIEAI